jgi:hypothetical protein
MSNENRFKDMAIWVLAAAVAFTGWQMFETNKDMKRMKNDIATMSANANPSYIGGASPSEALNQNFDTIIANQSYNEILLEGVVRKLGLPIDRARAEFEKRPGGVPATWQWNSPWESVQPAEKTPADVPAKPATPAAPTNK